jgi:hypothetical protein
LRIWQEYQYQTDIEYHKKYTLHWMQCKETRKKIPKKNKKIANTAQEQPKTEISHFEYVTNIKPDNKNVHQIGIGGRLRWKIENEGFNTQKNGGYELEHKNARKSYAGLKNYYTLLQIAHAIIQLVEKGKCISEILKNRAKETLENLWENVRGFMIYCRSPGNDWGCIENTIPIKPAPS